jgi:RNA polymerase I-specific transcription initiation factor RRN3
LFSTLQQNFPNRRGDVETHRVYLLNILKIVHYFPALRDRILELCLDKLIQLDVAIKLEDAPDDDEDELVFEVEMEVPEMAEKLDVLMELMFEFIDECISTGRSQEVWITLLKLFDTKVLTTHKSKYTQFLVFYLSR